MAASDIEHLHQLAVHSFYVGEQATGLRACERLLGERLTPEREALVRSNRTWYTQPLAALCPSPKWQLPGEPAHPGWTRFNPTIVAAGDGFLLLVRSSNYRLVDGRYVTPDEDAGRIRTENLLYRLDADAVRQGDAAVLATEYERSDFPVDGLEDVRLNVVGDRLVASGTIRNVAWLDGLARIGVADVDVRRPLRPVVLDEPVPGRHEKNWMPLVGTDTWLYSCHEDGKTVTASRQGDRWVLWRPGGRHPVARDFRWAATPRGTSPAIARGFRGGSQLIPCAGGWLACIHEVADLDGRRVYEHRFVWFDEWLSITHYTPPFFFRERQAIEFAAGLAWKRADQLVCTFGVRDEEAWITTIDYPSLLAARVKA